MYEDYKQEDGCLGGGGLRSSKATAFFVETHSVSPAGSSPRPSSCLILHVSGELMVIFDSAIISISSYTINVLHSLSNILTTHGYPLSFFFSMQRREPSQLSSHLFNPEPQLRLQMQQGSSMAFLLPRNKLLPFCCLVELQNILIHILLLS